MSSMDALFVFGVNVQKKTKKNRKMEIVNLGGFTIHLNYNLSNHIFNRESNPIPITFSVQTKKGSNLILHCGVLHELKN